MAGIITINHASGSSVADYVLQMYVCVCVILSVCLSLCSHFLRIKFFQKLEETDFDESFGEEGPGPGTNQLHFSGDPDFFVDPGSFSSILYH